MLPMSVPGGVLYKGDYHEQREALLAAGSRRGVSLVLEDETLFEEIIHFMRDATTEVAIYVKGTGLLLFDAPRWWDPRYLGHKRYDDAVPHTWFSQEA